MRYNYRMVWKKILIIVAGIICALGIFFIFNNYFRSKQKVAPLVKRKPVQTTYNFLLLGYGGGVHDGTYLTDTIMAVHIDTKAKKATLISIPRDLWVKLPTKSGADYHSKVNAVYQLALFPKDFPDLLTISPEKIISEVTGLSNDGYVSINFSGFTKTIDILGGVDVNVQKSFTDSEYPIDGKEKDLCGQDDIFKKSEPFLTPVADPTERINKFKEDPKIEEFVKNASESPELAFPCRYEKLDFKKGLVHMDGQTALKYARSRHSETDGGDFNRAARQQQIIEAVKNKVLSIGFVSKVIPLLDEYKKDVQTNIGLDIIKKFIARANTAREYKINSFILTDQNVLKDAISDDKQYILIPIEGMDNWTGIKKVINNTILGITPTPTATASAKLK